MTRAIVIGAGLAGLSAAVRLADRGVQVTVLERSQCSGGRIRCIKPAKGHPGVDFGQHLMLGCYDATIGFARRLGSDHLLRAVEGETPFLSGAGRAHPYRLGKLPAPLHMLPGLVGLTQLSKRERLGLARVLAAAAMELKWAYARLDEIDARTWLRGHGQSAGAIAGFWEPLVMATLNLPSCEASAFLLATVLRRGFLAGRAAAEPLLATGTLYDAFVGPAIDALKRAGGGVHLGVDIEELIPQSRSRLAGLRAGDGRFFEAEVYVMAIPSWHAAPLLGKLGGMGGIARRLEALGSAPIVNVDLWFDISWMRFPFAGLLGSPVQWVFRQRGESPVPGGEEWHRVSLVMSSAQEQISSGRAELVAMCEAELRRYFPEVARAKLKGYLVTKARRATMRGRIGQRRLRPDCETPYENLFLAGDWTATDLPATIESAVASGARAAECLRR